MFKITKLTSEALSGQATLDKQAAVVEDIARRVWNEHYGTILSQGQIDYMLAKFQSVDAIIHQIADGYEYYIIENQLDACKAGYFSIKPSKDPDGTLKLFLSKLYILKECRGKGAGSKVFDFLEQKAAENCLEAIWLTVNKYNKESISVYQHRGYEIVREQVADIGNGYVMDDFIMQKTMGPKFE